MDDSSLILRLIFLGLWSAWFLLKIFSESEFFWAVGYWSQLEKCFFTLMVVLLFLIWGLPPEKSLAEKTIDEKSSTGTKP